MSSFHHEAATILFDGTSSSPCTSSSFIRSIRQAAIAQDKQADDSWIAFYAAAHMDGPALDWYENLNEEVQESWKEIRRAILKKWPVGESGGLVERQDSTPTNPGWTEAAMVPTPAAAPPVVFAPAAAPITPPSKVITDDAEGNVAAIVHQNLSVKATPGPPRLPTGKIKGKIRVLHFDGKPHGYVSYDTSSLGYHYSSKGASDQLIVSYTSEAEHGRIQVDTKKHSVPTKQTYLGMIWVSESTYIKALGKGNSWGCLVSATFQGSSTKPTSSIKSKETSAYGIDPVTYMWHVLIDGTVTCAREEKSKLWRNMTPIMRGDNTIFFGTSLAEFLVGEDATRWQEVKLVFEPV